MSDTFLYHYNIKRTPPTSDVLMIYTLEISEYTFDFTEDLDILNDYWTHG